MYLTMSLVSLIERNAEALTKRWLEIVRIHPNTPTYHRWDERQLYARVFKVYSNLGQSISERTTRQDIEREYIELGHQRHAEGFALSEVIQALIISRRVLWLKIEADGFLNTALDLNLALELNNKVVLFFDRAIHYTALGYEEAARAPHAEAPHARGAESRHN
ncbi:MAG: hypothetical protein H6R26_1151 [Proteobacteria bacterium]|nr:hypothetical protein [Pseudomonadota bacterium]